jgi:2-polyprenyl-6-methoxyphenol hydroxylase-like FAD-dependent oxidoreductase
MGWRITRRGDALEITVPTHGFSAKSALGLAAHIAALAEQLRDEPDPEQVRALREWFQEQEFTGNTLDDLARAFLRDWHMPEERER